MFEKCVPVSIKREKNEIFTEEAEHLFSSVELFGLSGRIFVEGGGNTAAE
jgi:hypothetical protein